MMEHKDLKLYRRRIIPEECKLLKDDEILKCNEELLITRWNTLSPKVEFHHGCSCYFFKEGFKVSKFYKKDNTLLYWYCDIVEYSWDETHTSLTITDLLADVIIYPDGTVQVVDLDELSDALESGNLSQKQLTDCLRKLNHLLSLIYNNNFSQLQIQLNNLGL